MTCNRCSFSTLIDSTTGRQLPSLSSVLYRIISKRRYILAAQLLLREKSGTQRSGTDSNMPSLPAGSMIFIRWKLKMSYHTVYPISYPILYPISCCLPFVFVFLHMYTNNCFHLIVNILYITNLQPPSIFSLSLSPIQNLKEDLKMPSGMYSTIHLLDIMRRSAFKSPLSYPSSQVKTYFV